MTWHDAGDDLADGEADQRLVAGNMLYVVRQGDRLHAVDAVCPHKFALLADGELGDGCVTCPQHEATFDLATGAPGEGEGWAGRLPVHEARVEDGRIQVRLATS